MKNLLQISSPWQMWNTMLHKYPNQWFKCLMLVACMLTMDIGVMQADTYNAASYFKITSGPITPNSPFIEWEYAAYDHAGLDDFITGVYFYMVFVDNTEAEIVYIPSQYHFMNIGKANNQYGAPTYKGMRMEGDLEIAKLAYYPSAEALKKGIKQIRMRAIWAIDGYYPDQLRGDNYLINKYCNVSGIQFSRPTFTFSRKEPGKISFKADSPLPTDQKGITGTRNNCIYFPKTYTYNLEHSVCFSSDDTKGEGEVPGVFNNRDNFSIYYFLTSGETLNIGNNSPGIGSNYVKFDSRFYTSVKSIVVKGCPYPTGLQVLADKWTKKVKLNWSADTKDKDTSGKWFVFRRKATEDETGRKFIGSVSSNIFTYEDSNVEYDASYIYEVSFGLNLWGDLTSPILDLQATSNAIKIKRDFSMILSVKELIDGGSGGLELSWRHEAIPTDCRFDVLRQIDGAGDFVKIGEVSKTSSTATSHIYIDKAVSTCNSYTYKIRAILLDTEIMSATISGTPESKTIITGFSASKGTFSGSVKLNWIVKRTNQEPSLYVVSRRMVNNTNSLREIYRITTTDSNIFYDDNLAIPGQYYQYEVKAYADCSTQSILMSDMKDVGFCQSTGIVSGRIAYGTGTAVEGVKINLVKSDENDLSPQFRSMRVNGLGGGSRWTVSTDEAKNLFIKKPFTFQFWVNPDAGIKSSSGAFSKPMILEAVKNFSFLFEAYDNTNKTYKVIVRVPDESGVKDVPLPLTIPVGSFSHLTFSYDGNTTWTVRSIVGDGDIQTATVSSTKPVESWYDSYGFYGLSIGTDFSYLDEYVFTGYIDDVRFWTKVLTEKEVLANYNRLLAGNEPNLHLYWPMDEGVDGYTFDISRTGGIANENHGIMVGGSSPSEVVPTMDQLSLYGLTDGNGNYTIRGVPFTNDGSTYSIVPTHGIHQFSPTKLARFISNTSLSHNGVDFSDVSSFPVSGVVYYENTTCPVPNANLYVDGNICSKDGEVIETNNKGEFTISVPIGDHFIQVKKQGHTFVGNGRYPSDPNGVGTRYTFVNPINNLAFYDNTLVTITGRVAGGNVEDLKPLGLNQGKSNIGQAKVTLKTGYKMNVIKKTNGTSISYENNPDSLFYANPAVGMASKAFVKGGTADDVSYLTILTDPKTGEFAASVPPVEYEVEKVEIVSNKDNIAFEKSSFANLNATNPLATKTDSTTIDGVVKKFSYIAGLKVIHRKTPTFTVTDKSNESGAFGEKEYLYQSYGNPDEKIELYTIGADKTVNYTFGHPVFIQMGRYSFLLKAFEEYTNYDGEAPVKDMVPLQNSVVTITNEMSASQKVYVEGVDDGKFVNGTLEENQLKLDSLGTATYSFTTGFPNITAPYTRELNMTYTNNGELLPWSGNGLFKAYVLGELPSGNNFVTSGPDKVLMVLRDPPGSLSSAFFEKGTTITTTEQDGGSFITNNSVSTLTKLGADVTTIQGTPGFGVITELQAKHELEVGLDLNYVYSGYKEWETTTVTTERISTSDVEYYVGSMGDVFIGTATNLLFGNARNVGIRKEDGNFVINQQDAISTSSEFTTGFKYTQYYVEKVLIPNLYKLRNSLILSVPSIDKTNPGDTPIYLSTLQERDERFGSDNYDEEVWKNQAVAKESLEGPSYTMVLPDAKKDTLYQDQVRWYNSQIASWKQTLANNEQAKVKAIEEKIWLEQNHSFDTGAFVEASIRNCDATTIRNSHEFETLVTAGLSVGAIISGTGVAATFKTQTGGKYFGSDTDKEETCTTIGYTLKEVGFNDALTVDVYRAPDGFGPIFRTRGGQTSCPYEGAGLTKYYRPGFEISSATMQIEIPELSVDNPSAIGVPSGKPANYTLQLRNLSEAGKSIWFTIAVDDESNPNGAKLTIDGVSIKNGRDILVPAGQQLTKALQLTQTDQGIYDYKDIRVVLKSQCQGDPTDTQIVLGDTISLTAQFIPSCSDIRLEIENRVMNNRTTSDLKLVVKDYDLSYKNLEGIMIQYKGERDTDWKKVQEYYVVEPEDKTDKLPVTESRINHTFSMGNTALYPDQTYQFRAITICKLGNITVNNETETISVIKDMAQPMVMGKPSPGNGILSGENEVSLTYNEPVQSSGLTSVDNFLVTGVLNGYPVAHSVAAKLQGTPAYTEAILDLGRQSFSVDMWLKYTGSGILFMHGSQDKFEISINTDQQLEASIGGVKYTSEQKVPSGKWVFLSFAYTYKEDHSTLSASAAFDASTITLFKEQLVSDYQGKGRINLGDQLSGSMHEVSLWNRARPFAEAQEGMYTTKRATTPNLIGYWKMDEGYGTIAKDVARNRHVILPANSWYLENVNLAPHLDGSKCIVLNTSSCPVASSDDYTAEFWFSGGKQKGEASLMNLNDSVLDIRFDINGQLSLIANKVSIPLSSANYLDNLWHHLALNVYRNGTTSVYVDGELVKQLNSSQVPALAAAQVTLGACRYQEPEGLYAYHRFFTGQVDEVRLWKALITPDVIRQNRYNRLSGNEAGLIAYYPFEKKTLDQANQVITTASWSDQSLGKATDARPEGGAILIDQHSPALKEARTLTNVKFSFTASDSKIIINVDEEPNIIEGCTLQFTVREVRDKNGNLGLPITWSAFVNQNQLKWSDASISLEKEIRKEQHFTAEIYNRSGSAENWVLTNLPSWLSVNEESGTLQPLASRTLTFTVNSAAPVGKYEATVYLTGNNKINEPLLVQLVVSGIRPDWKVNPADYESSMNITGKLFMNGIPQEDESDLVAAFIGSTCVGVSSPVYVKSMNAYYLFMEVYGNSSMKENLKFRLWDASTGTIYPKVTLARGETSFVANAIYGTPSSPETFNATDIIEQSITFDKGWNWFSINLFNASDILLEQFKRSISNKGITIKGSNAYLKYENINGTWLGNLTEINNTSMYLLQTSEACRLTVEGKSVLMGEIPVLIGWNWLGYQPQFTLPIAEALASLNPAEGDAVKTKSGYAIYVENQAIWVGSLTQMAPGEGYLYRSEKAGTLVYPSQPSAAAQSYLSRSMEQARTPHWSYRSNCAYTMTVSASIDVNGLPCEGSQWECAAFIDQECRYSGFVRWEPVFSKWVVYLSVQFNPEDVDKTVSFRLYNHDTGEEMEISRKLKAVINANYGLEAPDYAYYPLSVQGTGLGSLNSDGGEVYPTVTQNFIWFTHAIGSVNKIELTDLNGQVLLREETIKENKVNLSNLEAGTYLLRICTDTRTYVYKVIKK